MAELKINGKVTHYAGSDGVVFQFQEIDKKKSNDDTTEILSYSLNIPFSIWKKFKDSEVEITIKKV